MITPSKNCSTVQIRPDYCLKADLMNWSILWDSDFSHDLGGMEALKRDLGVNFPLTTSKDEVGTTHTHDLEWMLGSRFHRKHLLRTFHAHESPSHTATIVSLLTERGSSLENKVRRVGAGDATRCCPLFGVSVVLCPLIVCCQLPGNGNSRLHGMT